MVTKYFIREDGEGAYVEGDDKDILWEVSICLEVPKRPSFLHKWNNVSKQWELDIEDKREYIRAVRNAELRRTDRFLISDFPITAPNKTTAETYRQSLRDLPTKQTIGELEMPSIPVFMQD